MQVWEPGRYATHARFVSDLGAPVVELLDPRPGERVLDVGCGDGALTEKLVEAGCRVVAIDASPNQVRAARERGLDARVANATGLDFDGEFDAVFSNAVLHWIQNPDAALAAIHRALAPAGGSWRSSAATAASRRSAPPSARSWPGAASTRRV